MAAMRVLMCTPEPEEPQPDNPFWWPESPRPDEEAESLEIARAEYRAALLRLKRAAPQQGGAVVSLLGNHEVMNAAGITYMASARSAAAFEDRATAFLPGTALATELSSWPVACIVGDTAFCHATLTLAQVEAGLQAGNAEASRWLLGGSPTGLPPDQLLSRVLITTGMSVLPGYLLWARDRRAGADGLVHKLDARGDAQHLTKIEHRELGELHDVQKHESHEDNKIVT